MSITVQQPQPQPQPYDLLTDVIRISGVAAGAFEANYQIEVTEGHDSVESFFMTGEGFGGHTQFQTQIDVSGANFTLPRVFVHVFHNPRPTMADARTRRSSRSLLGSQLCPASPPTTSMSSGRVTPCGPSPPRR